MTLCFRDHALTLRQDSVTLLAGGTPTPPGRRYSGNCLSTTGAGRLYWASQTTALSARTWQRCFRALQSRQNDVGRVEAGVIEEWTLGAIKCSAGSAWPSAFGASTNEGRGISNSQPAGRWRSFFPNGFQSKVFTCFSRCASLKPTGDSPDGPVELTDRLLCLRKI